MFPFPCPLYSYKKKNLDFKMKKHLLIAAGILSLTLGGIGIFLPLLPTTPFLLLSSACFVKSSTKLHNWLINHKIFGLYIKNYIEHKAITLRSKIVAISLLWICITSSTFFFIDILWLRILLFIIAAGVTIHLLKLKTLTKDMMNKKPEDKKLLKI